MSDFDKVMGEAKRVGDHVLAVHRLEAIDLYRKLDEGGVPTPEEIEMAAAIIGHALARNYFDSKLPDGA